jgi:hypothetical protein
MSVIFGPSGRKKKREAKTQFLNINIPRGEYPEFVTDDCLFDNMCKFANDPLYKRWLADLSV